MSANTAADPSTRVLRAASVRARSKTKIKTAAILGPIVFIGLWWAISAILPALISYRARFFPSPPDVIVAIVQGIFSGELLVAFAPTLGRFLAGYILSALVGIGIGLLFGLNRTLREMFLPAAHFVRAIPGVALIPIVTLFFGLSEMQKIVILVLVCTWPILLSTVDGVRALDEAVIDTSRAYRIRRSDNLFTVVIPAAAPQIFAGLRVALAGALLVVVTVELIGSTSGIGFYLKLTQSRYEFDKFWAAVILLGLLGVVVNQIFVYIEKRALAWHRGMNESPL